MSNRRNMMMMASAMMAVVGAGNTPMHSMIHRKEKEVVEQTEEERSIKLQRAKEDLSKVSQGLVAGEKHPEEFTIQENGRTFLIKRERKRKMKEEQLKKIAFGKGELK